MNITRRFLLPLHVIILVLNYGMHAQPSTVFATVVATKLFVVGAANPLTGVFYQGMHDDTVWQHMGPNNIRANGLAVTRHAKGETIYIAAGNGLHKSTDGGKTWRVTTGWEITEILWVSPHPRNPDTVYIATAYGIYKTMDGCRTWTQMNSGLTSTFTPCVIIDYSRPSTLYCATEDGAFVSHNGAASWERTGLSVSNVRVIAQHPRDPSILAVGTENNGIYMSHNAGTRWTKCEAGIDHTTFYTVAFDPQNPETMYAGGYVTGVYKSVDGGKSWKRMNDGMTCLNVHSVAVDPSDSNRVYAATLWGGVFTSDNGGATWRTAGLPESEVWTVVFRP
jgi:photosystem II stability/assembly factor-like uncharacterized protein